MKQAAAVGGGLVVVAVIGLGLAFALMGGPDAPTEAPEAAEVATEAPVKVEDRQVTPARAKVRAKARANPARRQLQVLNSTPKEVKPGDPPPKTAEDWKEIRSQRNQQWRDKQIALASEWVNSHDLDEGKGEEVLDILNRAHDIIGDTRADIEGGVINPRVGREEMDFAKEEIDLEVKHILGDELGQDFLTYILKADGLRR